MEEFFYIRQCLYWRCFPNVNFKLFPQFFAQSDNSLLVELSSSLEETQPTVAGTKCNKRMLPKSLFLKNCNNSVPLYVSVSGTSSQLGQEDQSRFPVVPNDEIIEINESAASKNTKRTTQT